MTIHVQLTFVWKKISSQQSFPQSSANQDRCHYQKLTLLQLFHTVNSSKLYNRSWWL